MKFRLFVFLEIKSESPCKFQNLIYSIGQKYITFFEDNLTQSVYI